MRDDIPLEAAELDGGVVTELAMAGDDQEFLRNLDYALELPTIYAV